MSHVARLTLLALITSLAVAGCSGDDEPDDPDAGPTDVAEDVSDDDADDADDNGDDLPDERTADCDPLMPEYCSMPWPSNQYLEHDDQRTTGYTLDFGETTLPESDADGEHVDNQPFRHLDGYGLGTPIAVLFDDVDTSGMPAEDAIEDSVEDDDRDAFLFEVTDDGLEAVPFWAELDAHAESGDDQILFLRPGVVLREDTRYIVAFRDLVDNDGDPVDRPEAFDDYLTGEAADDEELAWRADRFDEIIDLLDDEGLETGDLTLAWDFQTASSDALHGDLLHIVDEGLEEADDNGIDIELSHVAAHSEDDHDHIAYEIRGTYEVPHFLEEADRTSAPQSYLMHRDDDGNPAVNDTREATFWLQIPHSAVDGDPHGLVKYGHGMLGSGDQVSGSFNQQLADEHELIFFASDFIGFSDSDVPQAVEALGQPTYFEELVDRMHQGVLEYVLLTEAMQRHLSDLPDEDELDDQDLQLTVDDDRIYYSGISQGGIFGTTLLAVDPTITRGHLGVPGHNYSMMMERSTNFFEGEPAAYYDFVADGFPDRVDQAMVLPVIQLLWDKIDPVSYVRRLEAEPFDEETPKHGLFAAAKGDYQVAVVTKEITARSGIDIPVMENYDRDRGEPWGADVADYPHDGSAVVLYDFDNPWPEAGNKPPEDDLDDPHGLPRQLEEHNDQMIRFLDEGEVVDVCDGEPCYFPDQWDD